MYIIITIIIVQKLHYERVNKKKQIA